MGTFARALDCSSSVRQPSLHMSAAAASRDITLVPSAALGFIALLLSFSPHSFSFCVWLFFLSPCADRVQFHAMDTLHRHGYDLSSALSVLVPQGGPVLCRDEMEEWSSSEANLFEEALEKYGKDFNDIRQDFVSPNHKDHRWSHRDVIGKQYTSSKENAKVVCQTFCSQGPC